MQLAASKDKTNLSPTLTGKDLDEALELIAQQVSVIVPKDSTITDYIGRTQPEKKETETYNFDVVTEKGFTLQVGSKTYTGKPDSTNNNTWKFEDGSTLVYTAGTDEHFVLTLGQDIVRGGKVTLSYQAKLVRYDASRGHHDVLTNVQAYLTPVNTGDGLLFPEPSLGYRIGGSKPGEEETIIPDDDVPLADLNEIDHYA